MDEQNESPAPKIYNTTEAASALGVDARTIRRHCERLGVGRRIRGGIVLTDADLERLRGSIVGRPGNPNFTRGNYFGGSRKRKSPREQGDS